MAKPETAIVSVERTRMAVTVEGGGGGDGDGGCGGNSEN